MLHSYLSSTSWVRNCPTRLLAIAATVCLGIGTSAPSTRAAPVAFLFEATVTHEFNGSPFDLPFSYQVGDVLRGEFSFDPSGGSPVGNNTVLANQAFPLIFHIGEQSLANSHFSIRIADDTAMDDSGFPEPIDVIELGCAEPGCTPELLTLPGFEPFRVRSRMELVGDGATIASPEIPATTAVWNAFELQRRIVLEFDNEGVGAMGLQATIGAFRIIPEPASLILDVVALAFALFGMASRPNMGASFPSTFPQTGTRGQTEPAGRVIDGVATRRA